MEPAIRIERATCGVEFQTAQPQTI